MAAPGEQLRTFAPGTHRFGPENATLTVRTGRTGPAARAGHDLEIEVGGWSATLEVGDTVHLIFEADPASLRVRRGTGGLKALGKKDTATIASAMAGLLGLRPITFASSAATLAPDGRRAELTGPLDLAGRQEPVTVELALGDDGTPTARATVQQTRWGLEPPSVMFGALKVADTVEVEVRGGPQAH